MPESAHLYRSGRKRAALRVGAASVLALLAIWANAEYTIRPLRVAEPISIDGRFDELAWTRAVPITEFTQMIPNTGEPISERTEVRILYDDRNLYLGYVCHDDEMDKVVINDMRRDSSGVRSNDHAFVFLDPYNDRNTAVFFRFNAVGGMEDTAVSDGGNTLNESWDAVWECAGAIHDDHWVVEVAIPFSQLRFREAEEMTWAINVGRDISRKREISTWSPAPGGYGPLGKYRPSYFGELTGLGGIPAPKHLELLPYASPGVSRMDDTDDGVFELGLDAKYGITSNLTADVTLNTDFAQVEADEGQINLTRFDLFFPEKRPFFMEGASRFDFGIPRVMFERPPPLLLFYSRRVGLSEGRAIPVLAGTKVTGKAGPYGVGLLNVLTDEFHDAEVDVPRTNSTVLRLTRNVMRGSSVGVIGVNRQDGDTYNRAAGMDFSLRPRGNVDIHGLWARTFEEDAPAGARDAYYIGGDWTTTIANAGASYADIGEALNPGLGFVRRTGVKSMRGSAQYTPWPRKHGIRSVEIGPEFDLELARDNELASREAALAVGAELESGWRLSVAGRRTAERIQHAFDRYGSTIHAGEYHFTHGSASVNSRGGTAVSTRVRFDFGEFFDGDRLGGRLSVSIRPNARLMAEPFAEKVRVTLPSSQFDATLVGGRVAYSFSPRMYARVFAQWSDDIEELMANVLFNWIYRPGSDLYIVVNQTYGTAGGLDLAESTALAKLTYWWSR